jgi:solute carrier family 25 carnitine/acylcarnitine transporter 20/29
VAETGSSTVARDTWQVVQDLYAAGGVGAFYDGITPKLLRAAVFHAVTFWVYDTILPSIESATSIIHVSS